MRLIYHLEDARLHEIFQSAYKKGQSTETALTRIHNDILRAIDDGECVILVLLDLSAAFDTVDHNILITRLKYRFGITGKALGRTQSYLSGRTQFVKIGAERSSSWSLFCCVPQGSVLGPILYSPAAILKNRGASFLLYYPKTMEYPPIKYKTLQVSRIF